MRLASGVLAVAILVAGVAGPFLEEVLHHGFDASLADTVAAATPVTTDDLHESTAHGVVPMLSVLFLVLGAAPAYYVYVAGRASPQTIIERYPIIRGVYTFFWHRWFMDGFYNRVFVGGTLRMATIVAEDLEARFDNLVHHRLPSVFTERAQQLVHRLRADTEELLYNVSYVLVIFVMLLTYLFLGTGG